MELIQRVNEIKQIFLNSDDSERMFTPILERISRIKSDRLGFHESIFMTDNSICKFVVKYDSYIQKNAISSCFS